MSGHIVQYVRTHPMLDEQKKRYAQDLKVHCAFCGAQPGEPCVSSWTHPSRSERAKTENIQPPNLNDLPNHLKRDLLEYCKVTKIDPRELHNLSGRQLFEFYCNYHGLIDWSDRLIDALTEIRKVRNV